MRRTAHSCRSPCRARWCARIRRLWRGVERGCGAGAELAAWSGRSSGDGGFGLYGGRGRGVGEPASGRPVETARVTDITARGAAAARRTGGRAARFDAGVLARTVPALDPAGRPLRHQGNRAQAGGSRCHDGEELQDPLGHLDQPLRRRHLDETVRCGHRPHGPARPGLGQRRALVDDGTPPRVRERPGAPAVVRGDRQRQPGKSPTRLPTSGSRHRSGTGAGTRPTGSP